MEIEQNPIQQKLSLHNELPNFMKPTKWNSYCVALGNLLNPFSAEIYFLDVVSLMDV